MHLFYWIIGMTSGSIDFLELYKASVGLLSFACCIITFNLCLRPFNPSGLYLYTSSVYLKRGCLAGFQLSVFVMV